MQGISDLITVHGLINLDFADVKAVMSNAGSALMGIGRSSGENRAVQAAQQAVESPLLEVSIDGARGILFNIIGGNDMSMHEINTAAETITTAADPEANIIFGATIDPDLEGEIVVTVVATGFDAAYFSSRALPSVSDNDSTLPSITDEDEETTSKTTTTTKIGDDAINDIDMDLDSEKSSDFSSETPMPNIWSLDGSTDSKKDEKSNKDTDDKKDDVLSEKVDEEELEKPSFLRRLKNKRSKDDKDKKTGK